MFFGFSNQPKRRGPPVVKRKARPMNFSGAIGGGMNFGNPGGNRKRKNSMNKGDWDRDGVTNMRDCRPMNFNQHSALWRADIRSRVKIIEDKDTRDIREKYLDREKGVRRVSEKNVVRFFEKNPEMLKVAEDNLRGVRSDLMTDNQERRRGGQIILEENDPRRYVASHESPRARTASGYDRDAEGKPIFRPGESQVQSDESMIRVNTRMALGKHRKKSEDGTPTFNLNKVVRHELGHAKQNVEGRSELLAQESIEAAEEHGERTGKRLPHSQVPIEKDAIRYENQKFEREKSYAPRPQRLKGLDKVVKISQQGNRREVYTEKEIDNDPLNEVQNVNESEDKL